MRPRPQSATPVMRPAPPHGRDCAIVARTGDRGLAATYAKNWPAGLIAPFGQAGVALGVQDAEKK